jgi:ATP-binding cassette subfamily F protein 3
VIEARNICLSFGDRELLRSVSFQLGDRGRLCLAGSNGTGKSTLFSILMGELKPDSGQVIRSGGLRMGMLRQHAEFPPEATAYSAALQAFAPVLEKARELEALHEVMGQREVTEEELHRLDVLQEAVSREGYYTAESETRSVLHGLGFDREKQDKPLAELSGGWGMRVLLAQLLLGKPDCLLLDEPTNHLDLESIVWLESYLRNYPGSLLLICHDRRFVDGVCEGLLDLRQGKLESYSLPYERYEEERALRVAQQRQAASKAQDEIERLSRFIDRFKAKASKASLARSAMKRLDRIEIEEVEQDGPSMRLRFPAMDYAGAFAFIGENLKKSYGPKTIFQNGEFNIKPGDKVALVGPNGAGKTTLMRILAGELPYDGGELKQGASIRSGYYAQYVELTDKDRETSILDLVKESFPKSSEGQVRAALGAMMFSGDDAFKRFGVLSGGERARVRLARLLLSPSNALLLDEPTNHLDLRSKDLLLDALAEYPGTVVFVSHDREFCETLATHVLRVDGGRIVEYPGDYAYYLHKVEQDVEREEQSFARAEGRSSQRAPTNRETRKETERRERKREKREAEVAASIESLENRNTAIDAELCREDVFSNPAELRRLSEERAANGEKLEALYEELINLGAEAA